MIDTIIFTKWITLKDLFLECGDLLTEEQREKIKKWI